MGEVVMDDDEVLIVGAGICGLATALGLHKKGIKSVVLERSETLRSAEGTSITIRQNGWRALDQLGVADVLRRTAIPIQTQRYIWLDGRKQEEEIPMEGESRCLRRRDLLDALYASLPPATVKFGCELESMKLDPNSKKTLVRFMDGTSITAKVVIGCDGAKSIVADFLNLKPKKIFPLCGVRGLSNYPNGHSLDYKFDRFFKGKKRVGRIPIDDKLVYWFCAQPYVPRDERNWDDPEAIRQSTLEFLSDYPQQVREMIEITDAKTLSLTRVRYRAPWDLLMESFHKGTVTVAGDAMHVMGPFLAQGGSAALEDSIVLARSLAQMGLDRVEEAFDLYVIQRRMRLVRLSLQTYLTGILIETSSGLKKFLCIVLMFLLFRNQSGHIHYDCGAL